MDTDAVVSQPPDRVAVFLVRSVATRYGGMTRAVLTRARLYANAGVAVRVLLMDHTTYEDAEESALRQAWSLPESVQFRYFWREAAPGGGGGPVDPLAAADHEPGLESSSKERTKDRLVRFYDDGVLVKTKVLREGRLVRIDRRNEAGRVGSREYFDPEGRSVRIDELDPETGERILRRWFDRSGECWLTNGFSEEGNPEHTVRHVPAPAAFEDFGQCVAEWVDEIIADCRTPVLFSDKRDVDPALLAVGHPGARKVAVLHNAHQRNPHRSIDPTKRTWRPLLENTGAVDAVIALTHRQASDINARHGATNVTVIPNPVREPGLAEPAREPGTLVAVARLVELKRLEDAISAFALAAEQVPAARFDIYGAGPCLAGLRSLAAELGVADRVRFGGRTDRPLEAFAGATASVLTSRYEGWGLVLTESMSVGTPAVAYDINYGPDEIIRHEVDGLLVPSGDIEALAASMVRLLGDPDYAAALGRRAREVTERFSHQRWRDDWTALFDRLADPDTRPAVASDAGGQHGTGTGSGGRAALLAAVRRWWTRLPQPLRALARSARAGARGLVAVQRAVRYLLRPRLHGGTACILLSASNRSSEAAVLRAAALLGRARLPVPVLVLGRELDAATQHALAVLPPCVPVAWFWQGPGGGRPAAPRHDVTGLTAGPVPAPDSSAWLSGFYRDGKPVLAREQGDRPRVYHYDSSGLVVRREELTGAGELARIAELRPGTGQATRHRYFTADGRPWLSVAPPGKSGEPRPAVRHQPVECEYPSIGAAQAAWIGEQLAGDRPTRLLGVGRAAQRAAELLDHPHATLTARGSLHRHEKFG